MKLFIQTYGCAANKADELVVRTILKKEEFVENFQEADICIILTCGVKGSTENKILNRLGEMKNKKVIVGGCLSKIITNIFQKRFPTFSLIGPDQLSEIGEIVEKVAAGECVIELSEKKCKHTIPNIKQETQAIVISSGCLGNCTYCATKNAKGKLKSFTIEEIISAVTKAVENGAKKILLTSQDNGVYGQDIGTDLPTLLKKLIKIPGDFQIRVGMMNPKFALKYVEGIIEAYQSPKIMKFIHIPIQAGSNEVLKKMKRVGTVEEFEELVTKLRANIPNITISTDIICGFAEETEEQFQETVELVKRIKPEMMNISKFYPRPNTEAMNMRLLDMKIAKKRSTYLVELYKQMRSINKD